MYQKNKCSHKPWFLKQLKFYAQKSDVQKLDRMWPFKLETYFICGQQWVTKKLIFNLMEIRFKCNGAVKTRRTNALFFSFFLSPSGGSRARKKKSGRLNKTGRPADICLTKLSSKRGFIVSTPPSLPPPSRRLGHFAFIPPPFISLAATLFRQRAGTQISKGNNQ